MSGVSRKPQSKIVQNQGTIQTKNPELFKLLLANSSENNKLPADTKKKQTREPTLNNSKNSPDSGNFKNIKNLLESGRQLVATSDHLKEKNILVSGAGDAKVTSFSRQGKENYNLFAFQKSSEVTECRRANSSNGKHVVVNTDSVDHFETAHKGYLQKQVKHNAADTVGNIDLARKSQTREAADTVDSIDLARKSQTREEDLSILSDIAESDRETLGSANSELAALRTPSRNSLNADFEGGNSLPSSPVHTLQAGRAGVKENNKAERERDSITPVSNNRTARGTPYLSSLRQHNKTLYVAVQTERQDQLNKEVDWNTISSSENIDQSPIVNTVTRSPVCALSTVNSLKHKDTEDNIAPSKTTAAQERLTYESSTSSHTLANLLPAETATKVSHTENSVTNIFVFTEASRESLEPTYGKINPAYSKLSPRLSPGSSQCLNAIHSKLLHQRVTDTSLYLEDIFQSRTNVPYHSRRLKSQGNTVETSGKVVTLNDSHKEKENKTEFIPDSLDIEKDSLEINETDNKKKELRCSVNSICHDQGETIEQSSQDSEIGVGTYLTVEQNNNNKLDESIDDGTKNFDKETNESRVIVAISESSVPSVDLQSKNLAVAKEKPKLPLDEVTNFHRSSLGNEVQDVSSAKTQDQHCTASLTGVKVKDQAKEPVKFVIKTHQNNHSASKHVPGNCNTQEHNIDPVQAAGIATRNSNRTISSVKMIYVESPTFTKEEEEVYRFVSSRLEDSKDFMDTYRELDMAAVQKEEKYDQGMGNQKRVRYSDIDERYEDIGNQGLHGEEVSPADNHNHHLGRPPPTTQSEYNANYLEEMHNNGNLYEKDPRNRSEYLQQAYSNHPALLQKQLHGDTAGYRRQNYDSTNIPSQASGNQQDSSRVSNQQRHLDQAPGFTKKPQFDPQYSLASNPQAQHKSPQGLLNHQGEVSQHGLHDNQQGEVSQHGLLDNQQGLGGKIVQHQHFPQQQHPTNIYQQEPHLDQKQQKSEQQNSKPPVRGLSLPTGPSYDPVDEEDLKKETSYQQGLRLRIEDGNRRTQQAAIPKLPMNSNRSRHQFVDPRDVVQDSLEYDNNDETARSFGDGFVQDSLNMYAIPQQQQLQQPLNYLRNPPTLPPTFASFSSSRNFQGSRLDNVNFDSEDYADQVGIRQQRVNPQILPRFYYSQVDQPQESLNSGEYLDDDPNTGRGDVDAAYDLNQRYEDRQDEDEEPMEAVQPRPPKYDYVTNNKENLGKQNPKSYTKIHEINKEEKERLQDIFIHPKPKSKSSILKKKGQDQGQPRAQFNNHQLEVENYQDMTPAEQVWAQRSASLAKNFDGIGNRGRRRGPGNLHKFNSDSSLNQTFNPHSMQANRTSSQQRQPSQGPQQQQQLAPDKRAFMTEMPTPLTEGGSYNQLHSLHPQHQTEVLLQPVTQQVHTQDGQRISVDVNLKLISPPSLIDGFQQHQYQSQPQQYQYQPQQQHYPPPQYYSNGQGRQYPARVANYDDDGGEDMRQRVPALEYQAQDYDSDNNEYHHGSPRERYSADEVMKMLKESRADLNPYNKIPPINRSHGIEHPSSAPVQDQTGSYMEMYLRQKVKDSEQPWYKVYGLQDYRRMQKEVRLGTLGPDLDSDAVREKREKMTRQIDYAKVVMEKNRHELANRKPPAFPRPKEDNDIISRRKLAMEYAKTVPKPTVKVQPNEFNNYELGAEKSPIAKHHRHEPLSGDQKNVSPRQVRKKEKEMDILDLEKLRQRYEEDKMNEAIIRRHAHSSNRESYF